MSHPISRRDFMKAGLGAASLFAFGSPRGAAGTPLRVPGRAATRLKVIVLGFDGMDPKMTGRWIQEGKLPAFERLRSMGAFRPLATSVPPQSPVAWSNFIAGTNPGGHAIFDFIHRDTKTYFPTFSASATEEATKTIRIGNTIFPLNGGKVRNLRQGRAFWQVLEEHGIPATIFKIPANYPPVPTKQRTISGLGTPDILGSYGTFQYFTTEPQEIHEDIGGGQVHQVYVINNRVEAKFPGPINSFKKDRPPVEIDFKVYLDPQNAVAKVVIQDHEFILREKEWSGWKRLRFSYIPTQSASGICMFYLKEVRPHFRLYVSPINIDPADAALPIATPESYAVELERKFGPFFTKGLPADTSALDNGVLDDGEFLEQDAFVFEESRAMLDYELDRFDSGLLFYYISSTDQRQHMFWRLLDENHPAYDAASAKTYGGTIERTYREADALLDHVLGRIDKDTLLLVMSDHGFNPYYRSFNLNTWLRRSGYLRLTNDFKQEDLDIGFPSTDWSRTKAYGVGLNSLYINQKGREAQGTVEPGAETDALAREIARKLEDFTDPKTGERVVFRAYVAKDVYTGAHSGEAPEIILGFNRGYRISFSSPLGRVPREILEDNSSKWSGDHMGAAEILPGILFANRAVAAENPALYDLTATIMAVFGIDKPKEMVGTSIFKE